MDAVTRNADRCYDEVRAQEDLCLRTQLTKLLRQRERLAPVRLEMQGEAPALREPAHVMKTGGIKHVSPYRSGYQDTY